MAEILFYHLEQQPLDRVLPTLIERSLGRGWRVVVQASSEERVAALDELLWTYSDESFLPHATDGEADIAEEAVLLTAGDANPNAAAIRFLVDGAPLPADPAAYERVVLLFDGGDEIAIVAARAAWREVRGAGLEATYWQQDARGRWEKRA